MAGKLFSSNRLSRFLVNYAPLLLALALECVAFEQIGRMAGQPGFASLNTLILVLNQSAVFGIMAVGMTFVIITGGIDLSVGSLMALGGMLCASTVHWGAADSTWPWIFLGWTLALLAGILAGGFAGLLICTFRIPPFIATLALMSSLRGAANLITNGKPISPLPDAFQWLGRHQIADRIPVNVIVVLAVFILGAVLLNLTAFGRHVRAIGGNEESARLSGVPIAWTKWRVYMLSGALGALAGLVLSSRLGSGDPKIGLGDELKVIAAVVVGGTSLSGGRGSIVGTFAGLLVVSVLDSGLNWIGVETFGQQVTLGIVILAAVLLDRIKSW